MGEPTQWTTYVESVGTAIGAAATGLAAAVAILAAWDARRSATAQRQETARQGAIALEAMLIDYHKAILRWADDAIDWMSRAHTLTFYDPMKMPDGAFFDRRAECMLHVSALIDRGRLFFPNEALGAHGVHKPLAFRGFRPVILDQLKGVHDCLGRLRRKRLEDERQEDQQTAVLALRETMVACRRRFVSEIQVVIDPQARQSRLEKVLLAPSTKTAVDAAKESRIN